MATKTESARELRGKKVARSAEKVSAPLRSKTADERPIWETVVELGSQISDEEWEKVPDDSSINYKQSLYGTPAKRA